MRISHPLTKMTTWKSTNMWLVTFLRLHIALMYPATEEWSCISWDPMPLPKWLRQGRNTVITSKSLIVNFVSYLNERLKERNAPLEEFNCLPTRDILHIYTIWFISALNSTTYRCRHTRCWTRRWYSLQILPVVSSTKYLWLMYIYNISSSYFAFLTYSFNRGKLV